MCNMRNCEQDYYSQDSTVNRDNVFLHFLALTFLHGRYLKFTNDIEILLRKPEKKLISRFVLSVPKVPHSAALQGVEMKRLKCMPVAVLFCSLFRLLYGSPNHLEESILFFIDLKTESAFFRIFLLALNSISFIIRSVLPSSIRIRKETNLRCNK